MLVKASARIIARMRRKNSGARVREKAELRVVSGCAPRTKMQI